MVVALHVLACLLIRHRAKRFAATLSHAERRKLYGIAPCLSRPAHCDATSARDALSTPDGQPSLALKRRALPAASCAVRPAHSFLI